MIDQLCGKVVYVAGPYSGKTRAFVLFNIQRVVDIADRLRRTGVICIVPHLESFYNEDALDEEGWIVHGLRLIERCDAVVVVPGWEHSAGTEKEIEYAEELGLPVFYWGKG